MSITCALFGLFLRYCGNELPVTIDNLVVGKCFERHQPLKAGEVAMCEIRPGSKEGAMTVGIEAGSFRIGEACFSVFDEHHLKVGTVRDCACIAAAPLYSEYQFKAGNGTIKVSPADHDGPARWVMFYDIDPNPLIFPPGHWILDFSDDEMPDNETACKPIS